MPNEVCGASGSEDEYIISAHSDTVRCARCGRWLYLTQHLRLPRHLSNNLVDVPSSNKSNN